MQTILSIHLFQFLINLKSLDTFFCKSLTMQVWEFCTCSWNSLGLLNSFIQILQQTGSISSKIPHMFYTRMWADFWSEKVDDLQILQKNVGTILIRVADFDQ